MSETLCIIKPCEDLTTRAVAILRELRKRGFAILEEKQELLSRAQAEEFYEIHADRPFFEELCSYMSSGPVVAARLQAEDAVSKLREAIGDTNPAKAAPGTIRHTYGTSIGENAIHGSDSNENAKREITFFFG